MRDLGLGHVLDTCKNGQKQLCFFFLALHSHFEVPDRISNHLASFYYVFIAILLHSRLSLPFDQRYTVTFGRLELWRAVTVSTDVGALDEISDCFDVIGRELDISATCVLFDALWCSTAWDGNIWTASASDYGMVQKGFGMKTT